MTSSITTMLVYILLYIEYLFLYPNAEPWLNAALCYLLLLGAIVYNVIYQSVWLECPKMKKKLLTNSILFSNLVAMLLIFMVEPLWKTFTNTWSISIILGSIMVVHMMFVSIQQWYVYKNRIR